jgi:hypothetical protein
LLVVAVQLSRIRKITGITRIISIFFIVVNFKLTVQNLLPDFFYEIDFTYYDSKFRRIYGESYQQFLIESQKLIG